MAPYKTTARESALACHDILATIFDHLAPTSTYGNRTKESRRDCRQALASSALASSTLSHHALTVLWRELESINPLLKTLPNCKRVDFQLILSGAILDKNWTRFQLYADRVRAIIVGSLLGPSHLKDPTIHPTVWLFLAAKCKGSPLMPRLRDLIIMDLRTSETPTLVLLISPSLRKLDIFFALGEEMEDLRIAPHVANSLLQTLPLMAPNLESLYFDVDIRLDHEYIDAFKQFARLDTLSMHSKLALDESALQMLPAITTLQDLSCSIDLARSSALPTLHPYTFQHLTRLHVMGPFDDLTTFMDASQLPSLTGISLSIQQPSRAREPVHSFAAVCRRCDTALLTFFRVDINCAFNSPRPNRLMQYFEPLLAFPNIKYFSVSFSLVAPSIHDDDLARVGAAWPRLSNFRIVYYSARIESDRQDHQPVPDAVRPTLSGLVDLARRCTRLDSFQVPELDARVIPSNTAAVPLGHGLRAFSVKDTILPSPESPTYLEAAMVFCRVFPSIDLTRARLMAWSHIEGWKTFLGLVESLRLGRTDSEEDVGLDAANLAGRENASELIGTSY